MALLRNITESIRSWWGYSYPMYTNDYTLYAGGEPIPFVAPYSALQNTPVYRATTLISNDIARTPAEFSDPNLERLYNRPNRFQSGYDFRRQLTLQALLYGNSFALINRRRSGEVYELVPLPIGDVILDVSKDSPIYRSSTYGEISPDNLLHIKASLLEGLWSPSPIQLCRVALTIGVITEDQYLKGIQNSGDPKLAFIAPTTLNVAARQAIINDYLKNHRGTHNAGKPLVLAENMRIEKIQSSANGTEVEAARKYSIQDVSRIFGVPTSYLSETSGSVYGSMEWLSRMYLDSCLSHWFHAWGSEYELKLNERPTFDTDSLIRPSLAETFAALRTGIEAGIITRNEARSYMDFEEVEGGDDFLQALNMGTGGGATNLGDDTSGGVAEGDIGGINET